MFINNILKGRIKQIHLVGIGGIGMSGIAKVLLAEGFLVTGSDIALNNEINKLISLGAKITIGHHEDNIKDADVLVYSSAISFDNPEIKAAKQLKIPFIQRAVMLAEIMSLRCGIAISGAHGKTTTTSLIGYLMHYAKLDPTIIIGGIVNTFDTNAVIGKSQFIVAEADESDGSFLHLSPTIAVVTNIDKEHLDYYQNGLEEVLEKFTLFLNSIPFYGLVVACNDDNNVNKIIPTLNRRVVTYGTNNESDYSAKNIVYNGLSTTFDLYINNKFQSNFSLNMSGKHNVLNTLAAIAVLEEVGIDNQILFEPLKKFEGVKRRFSIISKEHNITIIDDYAHHPTEIKAVLQTAHNCFTDKRIIVLFQPHRFSRTKDLLNEFAQSFFNCSQVFISDIYAASEENIYEIDSNILSQNINKYSNNAIYTKDLDSSIKKVCEILRPNDVLLTLGAGSVTNAGKKIQQFLKENL